jgi:hypothetical protein
MRTSGTLPKEAIKREDSERKLRQKRKFDNLDKGRQKKAGPDPYPPHLALMTLAVGIGTRKTSKLWVEIKKVAEAQEIVEGVRFLTCGEVIEWENAETGKLYRPLKWSSLDSTLSSIATKPWAKEKFKLLESGPPVA